MTQHNPLSLHRHIRAAWTILSTEIGEFVEILPPMRRLRNTWYLGTADAIYQNIASILEEQPTHVLLLSADHVYKMNYRRMIEWYRRKNADATIATIRVPLEDAGRFGIVLVDEHHRVTGFEEKPNPHVVERLSCDSGVCHASMGIYVFSTAVSLRALTEDAAIEKSSHVLWKGHSAESLCSARASWRTILLRKIPNLCIGKTLAQSILTMPRIWNF